jgi:hypothetical protein
MVDQSIREIILEPRAIVTVVDLGKGGSHARRTRQTGFAVDQQHCDTISHLLHEIQDFCGKEHSERVRPVRVCGIGESEL